MYLIRRTNSGFEIGSQEEVLDLFSIDLFLKQVLAQQGESPRDEEPYGRATSMKQNEPLGANMRPQPKNDNQKTIRKSYQYK